MEASPIYEVKPCLKKPERIQKTRHHGLSPLLGQLALHLSHTSPQIIINIINRTLSTQDLQTLCTASKRLAWVVGDCNYLPEISKRLKLKRQVTGITQAFQTPQTLHSPCPASYTHCHSVSRSAHKKTLKFGKH